MTAAPDAYAVLGVPPSASHAEIKSAHRDLVRRHHPDLALPEARPAADRRTAEINVAYGLVRSPTARASYDALRTTGATTPSRRQSQDLDRLARDAGRWAARFWTLRRTHLARSGAATASVGRRLLGRAVLAAWTLVGLGVGVAAAVTAQQVMGLPVGGFGLLAGIVAGTWAGRARGWRLLLVAVGADPRAGRWVPQTLLASLAVAGGISLDRLIAT